MFLFGPRQTGKSSYIREQLPEPPALTYNLLDRGLLLRLLADPGMMRREVEARDLREALVCVDEIQKCPELLDEVHLLIEKRRIRFLLTGSSARKLRRSGTNLFGGRGRDRLLHPFAYPQLRQREVPPESAYYGEFFEHFIVLEGRAWIDYRRPRTSLHYWRSVSGFEVDLVIDGSVAVEIKATERPGDRDLRGLRALGQEKGIRRRLLVCRDSRPQLADGIEVLPWERFLELLWSDQILPERR